jgi:D-psicose/D-tagatose/L-ribulose 3-epimerase
MKYGINLLLWTDDATGNNFKPILEQIKSIGYDGVEVPVFSTDRESYVRLGKFLDSLGLDRTAVTVRSEADDPISNDAAVRASGIAATCDALDCCAAMGATHLVGPFHSALGVFSGSPASAEQRKWAIEGMQQVAEHAQSNNVMLALEYLNRFETYLLNSAHDMSAFIDAVGHPSCRMMYDTFHAHIEEKNVPQAIRAGGDNIVHVHISENDRSTPGAGQIRWDETFDTLQEIGYDGWFTVEAFGLALPKLAAATRIWRRMFSNEETLAREALTFMREQWLTRDKPVSAR